MMDGGHSVGKGTISFGGTCYEFDVHSINIHNPSQDHIDHYGNVAARSYGDPMISVNGRVTNAEHRSTENEADDCQKRAGRKLKLGKKYEVGK